MASYGPLHLDNVGLVRHPAAAKSGSGLLRGYGMRQTLSDITPPVDLTGEKGAGPFRTRRPVFVDLLPPCDNACPAGEHIQAWLALAQAGKFRAAWEMLV